MEIAILGRDCARSSTVGWTLELYCLHLKGPLELQAQLFPPCIPLHILFILLFIYCRPNFLTKKANPQSGLGCLTQT